MYLERMARMALFFLDFRGRHKVPVGVVEWFRAEHWPWRFAALEATALVWGKSPIPPVYGSRGGGSSLHRNLSKSKSHKQK